MTTSHDTRYETPCIISEESIGERLFYGACFANREGGCDITPTKS